MYAANNSDPIQTMDLSAGTPSFSELSASAPTAAVLGVIGDFLCAGNISAGDQTGPFVMQWSGLAAPATWDTPNTQQSRADQSGAQTLPSECGAITYITQGMQLGIVLQERGVTRVQYVGGDVVFSFYTLDKQHGCIAHDSAALVGNAVYFLSADGFYSTDGNSV